MSSLGDDESVYDGTPVQAGLQARAATLAAHPFYRAFALREMVVTACTYPTEPTNRNQNAVEYTCRDLITGDLHYNVQRLQQMGGYAGGDCNVLHPAGPLPTAPSQQVDDYTPARYTDGDHVVVGFLNGAMSRPVIIAVLTHPDAQYTARPADGERRLTFHQGTAVEITKTGKWRVVHKSGATIELTDDGDVVVEPADGRTVMLGAAGLTALDGVVHGSGIDPLTGSTYTVLNNTSAVVRAKK